MGETYPGHERTTLSSIREVFERWTVRPQGGDPRIAALSEATLELFDHDGLFNGSVQFMIDFHQDPDLNTLKGVTKKAPDKIHQIPLPLYAAHLIRVGYQNELLQTPGAAYPEEFTTKEKCYEGWRMVLDDQEKYDNFSQNIAWRSLQTNVADRYKGVKAAIINHRHRFNHPINYLDVGASLGVGIKKLALGDNFRPIKRTMEWYQDTPYLQSKPWWNEVINSKLASPIEFGDCVGIDAMPGDQRDNRNWIFSCSFYPSELLDESRVNEFTKLETADPANFHGVLRGNFALEENLDTVFRQTGHAKFDVISFITVLSQDNKDDRQQMLLNAVDALAPNGLIIIQDFVRLNHSQPGDLIFLPDWREPYTYRTIVIDPYISGPNFREALYWKNSRCEEVRVAEEYDFLLR